MEYIPENILNIRPQYHEHDTVYIQGDRKALELLQEAINHALHGDMNIGTMDSFRNDGEGYAIIIGLHPFKDLDKGKANYYTVRKY